MKLTSLLFLLLFLAAQIRAQEPTIANSDDVAAAQAAAAADATTKANAAQAASIQRANHTGTQAWSTITSTPTTLSGYGIGDAVASTLLSTSGGANKVLQSDGSGNLILGPYDNRVSGAYLTSGFGAIGNIVIPDQQGLLWKDPATGANIFAVRHWRGHDVVYGEAIIESAWRIAILGQGPIQFGANDLVPTAQCLHITSGASSVNRPISNSRAISWQTKRYNGGGEEKAGYVTAQATSLSSTTDETVLRFAIAENPVNGPVEGFNGGTGPGGAYAKGNAVGTDMAEFSANGIWHPGGAPAFNTLTDGATITQTCSKYKTTQNAKVTLGGNRTLAISGALAGMRGTIFVSQDSTGSRTLTLPTNSSTVPGFALSTTALKTDRLTWEYDGTYFYWSILAGFDQPTDSDASAFFTAATITDPTQKSAVNALVIQLKAAGFWAKASAIYPFVGGNATAHSKDLKAAYNITWTGAGVTHDSNGITGNGTTAYGNTGLAPSAIGADANSQMMTVYCKTATPTDNGTFMGAQAAGGGSARAGIGHYKPVGTAYFSISGINGASSEVAFASLSANFQSLLTGSRTGASAQFLRGRGANTSNTTASTGRATVPFFILARNNATVADKFTNANLAFAMLGTGFTEAEVIQLESIVTTYQTTLSRANP